MEPEIELHLVSLAHELKDILEQNLPRDPATTDAAMACARAIRDEIKSYGYLVTWQVALDPNNLREIKVEVMLWKPKPDLSPEDQKIYDAWLTGEGNV